MNISRPALVSTLMLLVAATHAAAAERGFYVGGAYSSVSADYAPDSLAATTTGIPESWVISKNDLDPLGSNAWRILAGYRVFDWLSIEGNFSKFAGNRESTRIVCVTIPCPATVRGEVSTSSVSALAMLPRGPFDFYVRAGMARWQGEIETFNYDQSGLARFRDDGTDPNYGVGAQYHVEDFALRLEYERVKFGEDEADLALLGVTYSF